MSGGTPKVPEWQIFNRVPGAQVIADGLKDIPAHWSLTPIQNKAAKRDGWEHEPFIPHDKIADLILKGERKTSKKTGKEYTAFYSGFGLRTGEQSGGLVAIDIDGASAEPILQRMSGGEIPLTPEWTSNKAGRRQIVFQVPDEIRPLLIDFNRAVVKEFEDLKTTEVELLEFRYNNCQSCLPPSRHPQTGTYQWNQSPDDVATAIAPPWLCDLLVKFANQERQDSGRKRQQAEERRREAEERRRQRHLNTIGAASLEDVLEESTNRLHVEDIYNWAGHNWHYQGKTLQGCCPQHQSQSGKSFHVNTETLEWFCFGCNVGGGPVQYRYFAQGGNGTPRGKDFVKVLAELAADAGVQMPELPKPERDHPKIHTDTIEEVKRRADANIVEIIGQHVNLTKRGKDFVGLCPFHDEKTPSFSVSPSKQMYRCFGCGESGSAIKFLMELGSRSFTNAVLELAQRYQVEARWADGSPASAEDLRERQVTGSQWGEPDPAAYANYVGQEVEFERSSEVAAAFEKQQRDRQRFDRWQWEHGIPNWFREQLGRFCQIFKGFGKRPETKEPKSRSRAEPLPKIIRYVPGDKLPTPEQYKAMGSPIIRFTQGQRLQLIAELVALGWHDILDTSGTGGFKSHEAGLAEPGKFGVDRLWYFSDDHRNPTTPTVEANYIDLPVRNDGMKVDSSRKTALNNPHVHWPKHGETATTVGNCFRTKEFHTLAAKGYKQEAGAEAQLNIICRTCHMRELCGSEEKAGPGHSFRNDRREALASSDRIRASLNSSLSPRDLEAKVKSSAVESVGANKNAAFYDEAMRQLKPNNTIEAQLSDFDQTWAEMESKLPDLHSQLKPVRLALRPILAGEVKTTQETYHGYNDATIRDILGEVPLNLTDIIRQLDTIKPNLEEILKNPDSFNLDGVDKKDRKNFSKEQSKRLRSMVRQNSYREMAQDLQSLASNWLVPLLEVWGGLQRGALRIKNCVLTVTVTDTRHAEIASAMQFNVYLDATANRDYLALYLNISPDSVVQIQQETGSFENLTINQIDGLGLAGHNRSDSLKGKIVALKQEFKQHHPDIAFLDHKEHANAEEGDGWYFNHNRGSNEYKTRSAIAAFGIPYQDIGSLQALYMTLTGDRNVDRDAPGFSAFVQWKTQSEIAQTVGRLRANLRPDEPTAYYSCADFDLGFLEAYYPGATIKKVSAFDITPQAGSRTEQSHWQVFSAARQVLVEAGVTLEKLTQAAVAKTAGVSQGRIAQIAAEHGGWAEYKKLLATLLEVTYRPANNSPPLDEEQQLIANTYLPLAAEEDPPNAVEAMLSTAYVYGWRVFEAILTATSPETRGRLLAALISGLPPALLYEFMAIATEFQIQ